MCLDKIATQKDKMLKGFHKVISNTNPDADTESGGARKDFMGYYTLLGLDADVGSTFSQPDIKKAFHEAALRWHPDHLHVCSNPSAINGWKHSFRNKEGCSKKGGLVTRREGKGQVPCCIICIRRV